MGLPEIAGRRCAPGAVCDAQRSMAARLLRQGEGEEDVIDALCQALRMTRGAARRLVRKLASRGRRPRA